MFARIEMERKQGKNGNMKATHSDPWRLIFLPAYVNGLPVCRGPTSMAVFLGKVVGSAH